MHQIPVNEAWFQGAISLERRDGGVRPWRLWVDRIRLFAPGGPLIDRAGDAAGVRLRIRTDSRCLAVRTNAAEVDRHFDLTRDGELLQTRNVPAGETVAAFDDLPGGDGPLEIWLPHRGGGVVVEGLEVDDGATVEPAEDTRKRWVTYGSSITQCGEAHSPARTWPATAARLRDVHLTCLGFGGQCHIDPVYGQVIADLPADGISLKLGINCYGNFAPRTFQPAAIGLVLTIRRKQPTTPIALVSPILSPPRETNPSGTGLALEDTRRELAEAVQRLRDCGDANVHYLDGRELFGQELADAGYLPDDLHPNGDGYEKLGRNAADKLLPLLGL